MAYQKELEAVNLESVYDKISTEKMAEGGEVLPKIGSEVSGRWNDGMRWTLGTFKGETENGFEVYDFTIEKPDHIEYYSEISVDPYEGTRIFKSNNFKDRNYKNYHFKKEKMAEGGEVKFKDKVASIKAKLLKSKKVPKAVQKDYGKTFTPAEAEDSAKRIVGAMTAKERLQMRMKSKKKK
jgi:hypothetical protein